MARKKWMDVLHLMDTTFIPEEQFERARIFESICVQLDTLPTPTRQMAYMARKANERLYKLGGNAWRPISGKTMERIWYDWIHTGRDFRALIDKRYFKLHRKDSSETGIMLHPETLSPQKAEELMTWDELATLVSYLHTMLRPLGKWRYLYSNSGMFSDTKFDKAMRSSVFSILDGESIPDLPPAAKVQFLLRLVWAFYKTIEKRDKEKNASITKSEAAIYLANTVTKEWHKTAYKWIYQSCDLIKLFE